ncbi:MAG: MFS transporter [Candidatus Aenigmarchaeota archaeon]|nr:MFS transporter [Candidatus Aenigmarchaeota archaeon]
MVFLNEPDYQSLDKPTKESLDYSIADGIAWSIFFSVTSGVFLIGFALYLGATPFQIGVLSSLPFFANVFQIIGAYFLETGGNKKLITIIGATFNRLIWILVILTPFFIFPAESAIWMVILMYGLSNISAAIAGVAWLSWMSHLVPKNIMGRYFSKRQLFVGVVGVVVGLLGGLFMDYWTLNYSSPLYGFVILFSISVAIGLFSILFLGRVREIPVFEEKATFSKFMMLVKKPYEEINFRKLIRFGILWSFALGIAGPFFTVYMLDTLGLSYVLITALNTLFIVSGIMALNAWGRIVDRYGAKPVLAICALIISLYPFFFILTTKSNFYLLFPVNIFVGMAAAGVEFSTGQLLLRTSPQTNKPIFFSSFAATTGLAFAVATIIGGILASVFQGLTYSIPLITLSGLHFLFLIGFVLRLWSNSMVQDIEDPESGQVKDVLSDLKQQKIMFAFAGFYNISQFSVGIATLPLIYSMKAVRGGQKLVAQEALKVKQSTMNLLKDLEAVVDTSVARIENYKELKTFIPKLNVFGRRVQKLERDIEAVSDEEIVNTVKSGIEKLSNDVVELERNLENAGIQKKILPFSNLKKIFERLKIIEKKPSP